MRCLVLSVFKVDFSSGQKKIRPVLWMYLITNGSFRAALWMYYLVSRGIFQFSLVTNEIWDPCTLYECIFSYFMCMPSLTRWPKPGSLLCLRQVKTAGLDVSTLCRMINYLVPWLATWSCDNQQSTLHICWPNTICRLLQQEKQTKKTSKKKRKVLCGGDHYVYTSVLMV
jgi:hypothetical protein